MHASFLRVWSLGSVDVVGLTCAPIPCICPAICMSGLAVPQLTFPTRSRPKPDIATCVCAACVCSVEAARRWEWGSAARAEQLHTHTCTRREDPPARPERVRDRYERGGVCTHCTAHLRVLTLACVSRVCPRWCSRCPVGVVGRSRSFVIRPPSRSQERRHTRTDSPRLQQLSRRDARRDRRRETHTQTDTGEAGDEAPCVEECMQVCQTVAAACVRVSFAL